VCLKVIVVWCRRSSCQRCSAPTVRWPPRAASCTRLHSFPLFDHKAETIPYLEHTEETISQFSPSCIPSALAAESPSYVQRELDTVTPLSAHLGVPVRAVTTILDHITGPPPVVIVLASVCDVTSCPCR
jgi:hypothetical protein